MTVGSCRPRITRPVCLLELDQEVTKESSLGNLDNDIARTSAGYRHGSHRGWRSIRRVHIDRIQRFHGELNRSRIQGHRVRLNRGWEIIIRVFNETLSLARLLSPSQGGDICTFLQVSN